MVQKFYLDHFIEAQARSYEDVLTEIILGKKQTHWIWYIFPIIAGLGKSYKSQYFALECVEEANAYIDHQLLGTRYLECTEMMLSHKNMTARDVLGRDAWKFRASLTLFRRSTDERSKLKTLERGLQHYFDGRECRNTADLISKQF